MLGFGRSDDGLHLTWIAEDPSKGDICRSDLVFFRQVIEDMIKGRKLFLADKIPLKIAMLEDKTRLESPYQLNDNTQRHFHLARLLLVLPY